MFSKFLKKVKNKVLYILKYIYIYINYSLYVIIRNLIKVDNHIVMFNVFQGNYTCNCKYISEMLLNDNYLQIWVKTTFSNKTNDNFPKCSNLKTVKEYSLRFYYYLAKSKILFDNGIQYQFAKIMKKKNQVIINTFHGSMGLKRLDTNHGWIEKAKKYDSKIDYLISNSKFEDDVYRSIWEKAEILKFGHPRNDILFNINPKIKEKVCNFFDINYDAKICLYAPTFRNNGKSFEMPNFLQLRETLIEKFGGNWIILIRMHYKMMNSIKLNISNNYIIDANNYPNIQELICALDVGITDYSSWICDQVLTTKPGFLFTPDLEDYVDERGFYYSLDKTPFPICKNNNELMSAILNFDESKYDINRKKFLDELGCVEDGKATERVCTFLKNKI